MHIPETHVYTPDLCTHLKPMYTLQTCTQTCAHTSDLYTQTCASTDSSHTKTYKHTQTCAYTQRPVHTPRPMCAPDPVYTLILCTPQSLGTHPGLCIPFIFSVETDAQYEKIKIKVPNLQPIGLSFRKGHCPRSWHNRCLYSEL